jgi:hypothetical protein
VSVRYYVGLPGLGTTELTDRIWTALDLNSGAEELSANQWELIVEDPDSDLVIYPWRRLWAMDDAAPVGQQVIGMGSIADIHVRRSEVYHRSATSRAWHLTITDLNYAAHYRLFDAEDDPNRDAETDLERVAWFLGTGSAILFASATDYIDTGGGGSLAALDLLDQNGLDALRGPMDQSGRNAFILYDESKGPPDFDIPENGELQLFYAKPGAEFWASALMLTNQDDEIDPANGIFPLADDDEDAHLDPTRIYWKLKLAYDGGMAEVSDIDIAATYSGRETTVDASDLNTEAQAEARGERMLAEGSTPTLRIQWGYHCRSEHVNALLAGQTFMYRATHLGGLTELGIPDMTAEGGVRLRCMDRNVVERAPGVYYVSGSAVPVSPVVAGGVIQWDTNTEIAEEPRVPLDDPVTVGSTLIGFVATRAGADPDMSDAVMQAWDGPDLIDNAIAGTVATFLDEASARTAGDYPMAMSYDATNVDHTQWMRFINIDAQRPRGHIVEIAGIAEAPTDHDVASNQSTGGTTFVSPTVTATGPGYVVAGFSYSAAGPGDGSSAPFVMTPQAGAVTLTAGYAIGSLAPYSWFGYLRVESADDYAITLERVGTPRGPTNGYGWVVGFWPDA